MSAKKFEQTQNPDAAKEQLIEELMTEDALNALIEDGFDFGNLSSAEIERELKSYSVKDLEDIKNRANAIIASKQQGGSQGSAPASISLRKGSGSAASGSSASGASNPGAQNPGSTTPPNNSTLKALSASSAPVSSGSSNPSGPSNPSGNPSNNPTTTLSTGGANPAGNTPVVNINSNYDATVPLELEKLSIAVINEDKQRDARARFEGENEQAKDLTRKASLGQRIARLWKNGIAKNFYRQRFINAARKRIMDEQKLFSEATDAEYKQFKINLCKTFLNEADETINTEAGDSRKSLKAEYPQLHSQIQDLIQKYADRTIDDREQLRIQFNEIMKNVQNGEIVGDEHLSIDNVEQVAIKARRNFENLATMAEAVNAEFNHAESMQRVMDGFDVYYGNRNTDILDPHYKAVDKVLDKMRQTKIGSLVSQETLALAAGATASVAVFFGKAKLRAAVAIPFLGSAILGAAEAGLAFEDDRNRAIVDARYHREYDASEKRRKRIDGTLHDFKRASEVSGDLRGKINRINEKRGNGETISQDEINALLKNVADTKWMLNQEYSKNPVIYYSSEIRAPEEQLDILNLVSEAKVTLRELGVNDLDTILAKDSKLMNAVGDALSQNIEDAEKRAKREKARECVGKFARCAAFGAILGVVAQETRAIFDENLTGIFEDGSKDVMGAKLTAGSKVASLFGAKKGVSFDANFNFDQALIDDTHSNIEFVKAKDGTFDLMRDGKTIAKGLDWNADTGELTPDSIKALADHGIDVTKSADTVGFTKIVQVPGSKTVTIGADELKDQVGTNGIVRAHRAFWWDNNTPKYDLNELKEFGYQDPVTGRFGLCTGMTADGSFHGGDSVDFSKVAQDGKLRLFVSFTKDSQSTPIEIPGKILSNGQVAFVPEPGSPAEACFDASGKFIGKFAEVAQVIEENGDEISYAPLATVVGEGIGQATIIEETIDEVPTDIFAPIYNFASKAKDWEMPILLPFMRRERMKGSDMQHDQRSKQYSYRPGNNPSYNNGYGGAGGGKAPNSNGEISGDWWDVYGRFCSPRVQEGKELQLGQEMDWYANEMEKAKGKDYMDKVRKSVESSNELKNLSGETKAVVAIPVHAPSEGDKIYHTLSTYAKQDNVDFNSFTVILNVNWRAKEKYSGQELKDRIKKTFDEIERAKRDFPHLKVAVFEQYGHENINQVTEYLNQVVMESINKSIKDGRMSADNDVLIIRNDADVKHVSKDYIASYEKACEENPKSPLFTGSTFFDIERTHRAPAFGAVLTIDRMDNLMGAVEGTNIHTAGANFAYRAKHFAATSGSEFAPDYDWLTSGTAGYDDLKVGYNMETAFDFFYKRRQFSSGNKDDHNIFDPDSRLLVRVGGASIATDDTRYLTFYSSPQGKFDNDKVLDDAYNGSFGMRPDPDALERFREDIMNKQRFNEVVEQFEREMSIRFGRNDEHRMNLIMDWWFGGNISGLYKVIPDRNYKPNWTYQRQGGFDKYFILTDEGKKRFRQSLLDRMGDGFSTDARNTMQKAIQEGTWV